jgi:hypothetical protein
MLSSSKEQRIRAVAIGRTSIGQARGPTNPNGMPAWQKAGIAADY